MQAWDRNSTGHCNWKIIGITGLILFHSAALTAANLPPTHTFLPPAHIKDTIGKNYGVVSLRKRCVPAPIDMWASIQLPEPGEGRDSEPHHQALILKAQRNRRQVHWPVRRLGGAFKGFWGHFITTAWVSEPDRSVCIPCDVGAVENDLCGAIGADKAIKRVYTTKNTHIMEAHAGKLLHYSTLCQLSVCELQLHISLLQWWCTPHNTTKED